MESNTQQIKSFRLHDPEKDAFIETKFYKNGYTKTTGVFVKNKKSGVFTTLYENGTTKWRDNYLDGKQHGLVRAWYEDGSLELEENYSHGLKNGICRYWDKNGNLVSQKEYVNDSLRFEKQKTDITAKNKSWRESCIQKYERFYTDDTKNV